VEVKNSNFRPLLVRKQGWKKQVIEVILIIRSALQVHTTYPLLLFVVDVILIYSSAQTMPLSILFSFKLR
jgi:hypothetical protein